MSAVADFGPHLPVLRRYARALTGSQASGDACVRATLEAILSAPNLISHDHSPRLELFRLFHAVWPPLDLPSGIRMRTTRSALMLTTLEGLSIADAALVLKQSVDEVAEGVSRARAEIMAENRGRVLIIEDESIIAMHLQALVEDLGHTVTGVATTHAEALVLIAEDLPDLILADIRLADGSSGVEAVNEILLTHNLPVIFITAFPERLLSGEGAEPTYLITKPFLPETVTGTISQALFFHRQQQASVGMEPTALAGASASG